MALLNNRLADFCTTNNIISKNQLGFLPGNRTSDAHFIIHNLIQKLCHKNNSKIYSCFIDFSKAFDTIPRDNLLKKLLHLGIKGNFFNTIKHIYANDKACVKIDERITNTFTINQGVRQGCILSPLLFNIFMSDLPELLDVTLKNTNPNINHPSCIIWADDIILLSETEEGLNTMLKTMEVYCNVNDLSLNTDKTKCMIFNKTGRLIRKRFSFNNVQLETVRSYKYLGFLLTPSGEIKSGLNDLRDRALKAFFKLKSTMGNEFNRDVSTTLTLIDSLIKPILLYCSDFWGALKPPKDHPIEKFHHMACKHVLGVQKQTTNTGVLLELGRIPLQIYAVKAATKNWERIRSGKVNPNIRISFGNAIKDNLPWVGNIREYLERNGMMGFYINSYENKPPFIHKKLFQRLSDIFHQNAFSEISSPQSKLRNYGLLKTKIGLENYLTTISNPLIRRSVSKFRLSNHNLNIETGRYQNIPKEMRFCHFCRDIVECEVHFLVACPTYKALRDEILKCKPSFAYYSQIEKFQYLLSDENILATSELIHNCFEVRNLLVKNPKRNL